ncbi:MAG: cytochrome c [Spirosomataceae bacterium]
MYARYFFVFCLLGVGLVGCNAPKTTHQQQKTDSTSIAPPVDSLAIDLVAWQEKGFFQQAQTITVEHDPVYHQTKHFEGIALKTVLERMPGFNKLDMKNTQLVFECEDGYNPSMALEKVLAKQSFLAIKDLDAPKGSNWIDIVKGPEVKKIAPFYVVYTDVPENDYTYKWPYNLVRMRLAPVSDETKVLFPIDDDTMVKGYDLFRIHCKTCHSLNGVGGKMGPELNFPKSVTEYWKVPEIKQFVKNPASYRNEVRMPAQSHLSEVEINEIVRYLEYMAKHKKKV